VTQETFLNYRRYRWLWITVGALALLTGLYLANKPIGGRDGGTPLGYAYGALATIAIVWLMLFGLRKRAYRSSLGTLEGWLAAHVWIGIGLLLLVPLHAGFSFGCNVHTAAYVFMILTIVTGIWGAANYATLSGKITAHRGGVKDSALVERIIDLENQAQELSEGKSESFVRLNHAFNVPFHASFWRLLRERHQPTVSQARASEILSSLPDSERMDGVALLGILDQRLELMRSLMQQSRIKALLRVWLYVHVPVSCALCVALFVHIFSVFFLW